MSDEFTGAMCSFLSGSHPFHAILILISSKYALVLLEERGVVGGGGEGSEWPWYQARHMRTVGGTEEAAQEHGCPNCTAAQKQHRGKQAA